MPTLLNRIILLLSFVGLFVAGTLAVAHHGGGTPVCSAASGCSAVADYVRANWGDFPVASVGVLGYLLIGALAFIRAVNGFEKKLVDFGFLLSAFGALTSVVLTVYAFAVIRNTCLWCMGSMATMIGLFLAHWKLRRVASDHGVETSPMPDYVLTGLAALVTMGAVFSQPTTGNSPNAAINSRLPQTIEAMVPERANSIGNENAPVILIEFYDLYCPACRTSYNTARNMVMQSNGQLKIVFRHFPLKNLHPHAEFAALVSEVAADKGKYFAFVDGLFAMEAQQTEPRQIVELALRLGITAEDLKAIEDPNAPAFQRYYADLEAANQLGLGATPTFIVGKRGERPTIEDMNSYRTRLIGLGVFPGGGAPQ